MGSASGMREQLSFTGLEGGPQPTEGIFFAIFPEVNAAADLAGLTWHLRDEHGLTGRPLAAWRLHVSLHHLGEYVDLPRGIVAAAREAAAAVATPPFTVAFDRAVSFNGRSRKQALVLQGGGDGVAGLVAFRQGLGRAMQKAGLWRWVKPHYEPHMTLLYDGCCVVEQAVETVGWTVNEFVLVHSLHGQTRYVPLGRWPLHS
jgi:2'-5' RNA ligase